MRPGILLYVVAWLFIVFACSQDEIYENRRTKSVVIKVCEGYSLNGACPEVEVEVVPEESICKLYVRHGTIASFSSEVLVRLPSRSDIDGEIRLTGKVCAYVNGVLEECPPDADISTSSIAFVAESRGLLVQIRDTLK